MPVDVAQVTSDYPALLRQYRHGSATVSCIDREHNPGGETKAVRRQTSTSGINPAGSSRALRLDPLSLPLSFHAQDARADGGLRKIELHRERVVLHGAVQGMRLAAHARVCYFLRVGSRGVGDAQ